MWNDIFTLGFKLNDGSNCKVGNNNFDQSHTFDLSKKITKIESIISKDEQKIM